jgi:uncharacterized membrane protein
MAMNAESMQPSGHNRARSDRRLWIAFLTLCAIGAAAVARRLVALATEPLAGSSELAGLDAQFAAQAGLTLLHIVPSLLFVLLVPLQFVASLRRRYPRLHRLTGRVTLACGVVAGVSALVLSAYPVGGIVESSATILFGCLFLFSLGKAWRHIRNGRVELHREWATRMVAIALGVSTTRPIMGVFFATRPLTGLTPEQFFGPAMWLGFVATYVAGEAWIRHSRAQDPHGTGYQSAAVLQTVRR